MIKKTSKKAVGDTALDTWGQVSAYLLEVERNGSWKNSARTYTEWAKGFAQQRGCTVTLLWRYKSAGKFYNSRSEALLNRGIKLPKLDKLSPSVSAEAVELLAKISRVAPANILNPIEAKTLLGQIQKKEVREVWNAYAPLLEGKTARGRGVAAPKLVVFALSRVESDVLIGLKRSKGRWLPDQPAIFEVYSGAELQSEVRQINSICDAIILSRTDKTSPVEIHAIEIAHHIGYWEFTDQYKEWLNSIVDLAWIVCPIKWNALELEKVPAHIGVLLVSPSGKVRVLRQAVRNTSKKSEGEMFARALLARALRWWK